jgi:hypothetical protein
MGSSITDYIEHVACTHKKAIEYSIKRGPAQLESAYAYVTPGNIPIVNVVTLCLLEALE